MLAAGLGQWGLLLLGIAAILVGIGVVIAMLRVHAMLTEVTVMVKQVREQTVPMLGDVRITIQSVNKELERVDGLMESGGNMAKSAERVTAAVEQVVTSPLIKIAAVAAGAAAFVKRFRGGKG